MSKAKYNDIAILYTKDDFFANITILFELRNPY